MQLAEFNSLAAESAQAQIEACLGVRRWVDEVVMGRPYADVVALTSQAKASAENLTDDELSAALTRHPRIGERPDQSETGEVEAGFSRHEQSGVSTKTDRTDSIDDTDSTDRLRAGNERYEARFRRVFLVRAAGRSGDEIVAELERRIDNDPETERRETVGALREIAVLRLQQVVLA